jgi:hypothetical protein
MFMLLCIKVAVVLVALLSLKGIRAAAKVDTNISKWLRCVLSVVICDARIAFFAPESWMFALFQ